MSTATCVSCGTLMRLGADDCPSCGAAVESAVGTRTAAPPSVPPTSPTAGPAPACPSCSSQVVPGTRWCPICRTNVQNIHFGRLGSPGRRLAAYVLDIGMPWVAIGVAAAIGAAVSEDVAVAVGAVMALGYFIIAVVLLMQGTTPGKRVLGMRVIKEDGRVASIGTMFLREVVGKILSGMIMGLGYLWLLFDKENQAWHDKLASTYVVTAEF